MDPLYLEQLQGMLTSPNFPWYFHETTMTTEKVDMNLDLSKFTHTFFNNQEVNSDCFAFVYEVAERISDALNIEIVEPLQIKTNYLHKISGGYTHKPHSDLELNTDLSELTKQEHNYLTFVYYPFDSDGDTVLYKEHFINESSYNDPEELIRVSPKKNRCLVFESNRLHSSSNPCDYNSRIMINYVMKTKSGKGS